MRAACKLCRRCHSEKTLRESAQPTSLESRVAPEVMEYARSPKLPPLVFETQACAASRKRDALYVGVDVVRCRRNGLANAPFPLPILCGDHAAGHGALGGPGLRGAERRREVPAAGRLPAVAGRAGLLGRAAISAPLEHSQLIRDLAGGHMRSDPGIFNFVKWLRVGEEACYPSKPGWPDTTLVISHSKRMAVNAAANRALAPEPQSCSNWKSST